MTVPASCGEFPPAAKLVCYALRRDGPMTYSGLSNATKLPDTTLTRGIDQLQTEDCIEETQAGYRLSAQYGR